MTALLIVFTYLKFDILINRKAIDIKQTIMENQFDQTYVFDNEQGFAMAAAIISPDMSFTSLDPSIGFLVFTRESWHVTPTNVDYRVDVIESHTCSP